MKIKAMPIEAKSYKWIVAHKFNGELWYVNAWNSYYYAKGQAIVGGYVVIAIEDVE